MVNKEGECFMLMSNRLCPHLSYQVITDVAQIIDLFISISVGGRSYLHD